MPDSHWWGVARAVEARWGDAAAALVSQWSRQYAQRVRAASAALRQRCSVTRVRSLTVRNQVADATYARQQAAAGRHAAATRPDGDLDAFQIEALLDGRPVAATWTRGRLDCDPALRDRAELLVDLGEVFSDVEGRPRYAASLDGPALAVALTLVRACERVTGLALAMPGSMPVAAPVHDQASGDGMADVPVESDPAGRDDAVG